MITDNYAEIKDFNNKNEGIKYFKQNDKMQNSIIEVLEITSTGIQDMSIDFKKQLKWFSVVH